MKSETKRLFVAIRPPDSLLASFQKSQKELQFRLTASDVKTPGRVRWTPVDQMHVTLAFSVAFHSDHIDMLSEALAVTASRSPSSEIRFGRTLTRPMFGRPKLIWSPIEVGVVPLHRLSANILGDFKKTQPGSPAIEKGKFKPHLTLGRVSKNVSIMFGRTIRRSVKADPQPATPWRAGELELIESVLEIGGATHTILRRFPLAPAS